MRKKSKLCYFSQELLKRMRKEAKLREKELNRNYGVNTLIDETMQKEMNKAEKQRGDIKRV